MFWKASSYPFIEKTHINETAGGYENMFDNICESDLFAACREIEKRVAENLEKGNFDQALLDIASLRSPVDAFFDNELVMAEGEKNT